MKKSVADSLSIVLFNFKTFPELCPPITAVIEETGLKYLWILWGASLWEACGIKHALLSVCCCFDLTK